MCGHVNNLISAMTLGRVHWLKCLVDSTCRWPTFTLSWPTKTLEWNKIMWHVTTKHWYFFILAAAKKKIICMCCTIISKYIIWKYSLTKWTDTILAKVSIQSPLPVNSKLQITTKSQTLPPLKSNSIWVICLMVPTKNLKKGLWLLLWGWRILLQKNPPFLRKNKTPMENKCEGYPSTPNKCVPPLLSSYIKMSTLVWFF